MNDTQIDQERDTAAVEQLRTLEPLTDAERLRWSETFDKYFAWGNVPTKCVAYANARVVGDRMVAASGYQRLDAEQQELADAVDDMFGGVIGIRVLPASEA